MISFAKHALQMFHDLLLMLDLFVLSFSSGHMGFNFNSKNNLVQALFDWYSKHSIAEPAGLNFNTKNPLVQALF